MEFYTNFFMNKGKVYYRGYTYGERFNKYQKIRPYLFVDSPNESEYKSLSGKNVEKMTFYGTTDVRQFIEQYKDVSNYNIYGMSSWDYVFINDTYKSVEYDTSLIKCINIDIETEFDSSGFPHANLANFPITTITLMVKGYVLSLGLHDFDTSKESIKMKYIKCKDEKHMLEEFIKYWKKIDCDVVTGWNIENFDIPYLINRIRKILGEEDVLSLSPYEKIEPRTIKGKYGNDQTIYDIKGISCLDYLQLYKKFSFKEHESYALDYIAEEELDENKLDYSEYSDLMDLYRRDFQKYLSYNIHDVVLVDRLNKKLGFLEQAYAIAYLAKVNMQDVLTSVKLWDVVCHNYLMDKKIVVPFENKNVKTRSIVGGYVKKPLTGKYDWLVTIDATSLYPHLIMQYNISPETYKGKIDKFGFIGQDELDNKIEEVLSGYDISKYLKEKETGLCMTGALFSNKKRGFLPELMEKFFAERSFHKKEMLKYKVELEQINKLLAEST